MEQIKDDDIREAYEFIATAFSEKEAEEIYSNAMIAFPAVLNQVTTRDENLVMRKAYMLGALTTYKLIYAKKNDAITANPIDRKEAERLTEERFKKEALKD